jgi:hypothetical protein
MTARSDNHDYGPTVLVGPWARPTNPHPESPAGRAHARKAAQTSLPGTSPDLAGTAQRKADAPLKPKKPQEPCDLGMFSDSPRQLDLMTLVNATRKS